VSILIDASTNVLMQGITGREASMVTGHSLRYGTRIVAGVTPGKGGQDVCGVPVFNSVHEALAGGGVLVTATVVYVPPVAALAAVHEACAAGIRLILVMTERVPQRDVCAMVQMAAEARVTLVGPNSVGIITPRHRVKLGAIGGDAPDRCFSPGTVGIISRSGGMTGECAHLLRRAGLGVSTALSVGGDPMVGLSPAEALRLFERDPETSAVLMWGEPGTPYEEEAADLVRGGGFTKPLVAFIAGEFVDRLPQGTVFGHTAVIVRGEGGRVTTKRRRLREAGVVVPDTLNQIPAAIAHAISGA
jgi:succinyl-CoA synthetase alpha subunit